MGERPAPPRLLKNRVENMPDAPFSIKNKAKWGVIVAISILVLNDLITAILVHLV